jgi:hypothetical protein
MMAFASAMAVDLSGMRNDEFNTGMIVAICLEIAGLICVCIAIIKWVYGLFAYSMFIKEERIADKINSEEATVWFFVGWGIILFAGLLFYAYKPSGWGQGHKYNNNRKNYREGTRNNWNDNSDPNDYPHEGYDDGGY